MKIAKFGKYIKDPKLIVLYLSSKGFFNFMDDESYLKLMYRCKLGKKLDLNSPTTFNEKLQWLKIHDRNPLYSRMVDKYEAKKYVAEKIGDQYIIPTLGVWDHFDDIDFAQLPDQFVLKTTHDSGGIVICKDKNKLDISAAREKIEKSLRTNYYLHGREWPYKNVKPRIIAEQYMVDESGYELKDYKIFCFDGFARAMFIATDRQVEGEETKFDFYDMNFKHLPFTNGHPNSSQEIRRPESFNEMRVLAEKLSQGIPQVRVDFYDINGQVYFGELTLSHFSGMTPFVPEEWDYKFGEWIKLPKTIGGGYLITNKGWILYTHVEEFDENDENIKNDDKQNGLRNCIEYKFFCFNGKVKVILVCQGQAHSDGTGQRTNDFMDADFNRIPLKILNPISKEDPKRPQELGEMKRLAEKLADGIPELRVDFYLAGGRIYFGELTFFHNSGFNKFEPEEHDLTWGKWIDLPTVDGRAD